MAYKYEHFNSVYEFDKAINETRKVNESFVGHESSKNDGDAKWYQTSSYEEAQNFLKNGWNAKVEQMKAELQKFQKEREVKRNKQIKSVAGFAPCVPNAIRGVPKSMFATRTVTKKERSIHLVVNNCNTGGTSGDDLMKCGMTVLKLASMLDKAGVRTRIDVIPKMSFDTSETDCYGCSVMIKDYRQPFNLSKMAYPLANPSFFRRHGFHYLETLDEDVSGWVGNYGRSVVQCNRNKVDEYLKAVGLKNDGIIYIDFNDCRYANFDPERLAESKGIKVKGGC